MRIRHQLRQPKLIIEPFALTLRNCVPKEYLNMAITPGGEVVVSWLQNRLLISDLRSGIQYTIPIQVSREIFSELWSPLNIVAQLFTCQGVEGLVVIAAFFERTRFNVFFQPFCPSLSSKPLPCKYLGDLDMRRGGGFATLKIQGQYLILSDSVDSVKVLRIIDLHTGRIMSLYPEHLDVTNVEIYKNEFIFFHNWGGKICIAHLGALDPEPDLSPRPTSWFEVHDRDEGNAGTFVSLETRRDPVSGERVLLVWYSGVSERPYMLSRELFVKKMGEPYIDAETGSILSRPIGDPREYSTPFTRVLLPNGGWPARTRHSGIAQHTPGGIAHSNLGTHARTSVSHDQYEWPRTDCITGNSRILSHVTPALAVHTTKSTIVISDLDGSGQQVMHKPLYVRTSRSNPLGGETSETVEQMAEARHSSSMQFLWDETSGRLAVHRVDPVIRRCVTTIYKF
ncbi:hypothetical protein DL93DRAFT_1319723 [Clavulina sp. PMI_390]|nr:hypothetical protein DL93DRAFT_1319723 [Clavulina sp. PMI_390]